VIYLANPSTPGVRSAMAAGRLGSMMRPKQGNRLPAGALFGIDNACGPGKDGKAGKGYPGDRAYLEMLSRLSAQARSRCLFAVAPDVLCDAEATLRRTERFYPAMRSWFGLPVAMVAQDGLERMDVPWPSFDALFLGGSTAWKLGPHARALTAEAKRRGKHVHMGRVNSLRRLQYADAIGCDSADGTYLAFGPSTNLPKLLGWMRAVNDQTSLWTETKGAALCRTSTRTATATALG
jgi:hypothetical protein